MKTVKFTIATWYIATEWHKFTKRENIDKVDEFLVICQTFPTIYLY